MYLGEAGAALLVARTGVQKPTSGTGYVWVTRDWTWVSCLSSIVNGTGEGFLAIAADGTKYWFNWMAANGEIHLRQRRVSGGGYDTLTRKRYALYATRVEDRFGNWVTYSYGNQANQPARLGSIQSSDGRQIILGYTGAYVTSASVGQRTWAYQYNGGTTLRGVVLPDTSQWAINFAAFKGHIDYYTEVSDNWRNCTNPGDVRDPLVPAVGTITHPSGATGEFTMMVTRFARTVPASCSVGNPNTTNDDVSYYPNVWDAYALRKKRVTGPGLAAADWTYAYGGGWTQLIDPDGAYTNSYFGTTFRSDDGKLLRTERFDHAGVLLRKDVYTYQLDPAGQAYPPQLGDSGQVKGDDFSDEVPRPQLTRTITQQGVTFASQVNASCNGYPFCFDGFARPTSVTKASSLGHSKAEVTEYEDNFGYWVLGQVERVLVNGIATVENGFDSLARPEWTKAFGKLKQMLGYYADGTIEWVADGVGVTVLSNWKRGIPQTITHPSTPDQPAGAIESADVDINGWIQSITNESGSKTCYSYDEMGRVEEVFYPSETQIGACDIDQTDWFKTTSSFTGGHPAIYGVAAGHWRQVTQTGNARTVTIFDAMWRAVVQERYDTSNTNATLSQTVTRYDISGRKSFVSYPQRNLVPAVFNTWADPAVTPNALGTRTRYDALDRVMTVEQDSELGPLTTSTVYLAPFKTETTNPRTKTTRMSYVAYDEPTYEFPNGVFEYEGRATEIYRDVFGKPTTIRRRWDAPAVDHSRQYVYDDYQQLCKTIEPETGATLYGYDAAGNLTWSSAGLPAATLCEPEGTSPAVAARKVARGYDPRNRLKSLAFPDGIGNQAWTYTPDSLPDTITAYNSAGQGTPVVSAYHYNQRRMLDGQGETVTQPGWYVWGIGYGYDRHANLISQVYPTQLTVNYMPNALGQATQVTSPGGVNYASGVSYYPNGAIHQFTYGNGIVHTMEQNNRQLPNRVTSSGGVLDFQYVYDGNGNPEHIANLLVPGWDANDRWMTYDGLDRLTDAGSGSFGGDHWHRFTYDALDNLRSWKLGGGGKDYAYYDYDASNRLTAIRNSAGAGIVDLGYDLQGNLANKNGRSYNFDYGNRLRGAGATSGVETYRYDGHGRRVLAWRSADGTLTISQHSQAGQLLYQENTKTALFHEHIYLAGSLLASRETVWAAGGATSVKYQHTDALGSPVAVTGQNGGVIERFEYEPYGAIINKPAHDGIGYTGHVMDGATGLTYMQQRYYDPSIGRFLSVDPIAASVGSTFNRYSYAANNPYRFVDPDGREACGKDTTCRISSGMSAGTINGAIAGAKGSTFNMNGSVRTDRSATAAQRQAIGSMSYREARTGSSDKENWLFMNNEGEVLGKTQQGCTGDDQCSLRKNLIPAGATLAGHAHVYPAGNKLSAAVKLARECRDQATPECFLMAIWVLLLCLPAHAT